MCSALASRVDIVVNLRVFLFCTSFWYMSNMCELAFGIPVHVVDGFFMFAYSFERACIKFEHDTLRYKS